MAEFRTVLIVDDSATSRMIVQRCMEMAGASVGAFLFAENGLDALTLVKANPEIDLIVTDLNMPKMDGRAFARLLKSDAALSRITLIVASSIADGDAEAELRSLGVAAVVKKPISPAKMLEVFGGLQ